MLKRLFQLLAPLFFVPIFLFCSPLFAHAQEHPRLPIAELEGDIDDFISAGATGFLVWDWDNTIPNGGTACDVLAEKASSSYFLGTNSYNLASLDNGSINSYLASLRSNCATNNSKLVVRVWANNPLSDTLSVTLGKIQAVLSIAANHNIKIILVLADYANGSNNFSGQTILPTSIQSNQSFLNSWYGLTHSTSDDYLAHVTEIINTVGQHSALWGVELANEAHCGGFTGDSLTSYRYWAGEVSSLIRDQNISDSVRIGIGQANSFTGSTCDYGGSTASQNQLIATHVGGNNQLNVISGHMYTPDMKSLAMEALNIAHNQIGKPFYIGEAGYGGGVGASDCSANPFLPDYFTCDIYEDGDRDQDSVAYGVAPDSVSSPEYHSLRPYTTCPITPEIRDTTYMSCGNDLTVNEFVRLFHPEDEDNPNGLGWLPEGVIYAPDNNPETACVEDPPDFFTCRYHADRYLPIEILFDESELPFLGLTRDPFIDDSKNENEAPEKTKLDSAQKMNYYVSWYVNGAIDRAEQTPLATLSDYPALEDDTNRGDLRSYQDTWELINFSGPLRKLNPWYVQNIKHDTYYSTSREDQITRTSEGNHPYSWYTRRHDQIAVCTADMSGTTLENLHTIADFIISLLFSLVGWDYDTTDVVTDIPVPCYVDLEGMDITVPTPIGGLTLLKVKSDGDGHGNFQFKLVDPVLNQTIITFMTVRRIHLSDWQKENKIPPDRENYNQFSAWFMDLKDWYGQICVPIDRGVTFYFCFDESDAGLGIPDFANPNYWGSTYSYIPFSSTEDMTGYALASAEKILIQPDDDIFNTQPTIFSPAEGDEYCDTGYQNLYFPHIEEDTELARQLQLTFKPLGEDGFENLESRGLYDTEHCVLEESRRIPGDFLRPEHRSADKAPKASTRGDNDKDYRDALPISGNIDYEGEFTCTFTRTVTPPPVLPGEDTGVSCEDLYAPGLWCSTENTPLFDGALPCNQYTCDLPVSEGGTGNWIGAQGCGICANWIPMDGSEPCVEHEACEGEAEYSTCLITAAGTTSLYIAMPRTEELWERYVIGDMSIVRRIFPRLGEDRPIEEFKDIPARSDALFRAQGLSQFASGAIDGGAIIGDPSTGTTASAGDYLTGKIYFPHLGSIRKYFLNQIQKALRPLGYSGSTPGDPPPPPPVETECANPKADVSRGSEPATLDNPGGVQCLNVYVSSTNANFYVNELTPLLADQQTSFAPYSAVGGWAQYYAHIFTGAMLDWSNHDHQKYQHLFHECCGKTPCYDYILKQGHFLPQTYLNPYVAIAIALDGNGGLFTTNEYGLDRDHFACDPWNDSDYDYGLDIGDKLRCLINTFNQNQSEGANQALINYGYDTPGSRGLKDKDLNTIIRHLSLGKYSGLCQDQ